MESPLHRFVDHFVPSHQSYRFNLLILAGLSPHPR